jgi:hypothetical protein
VPHPLDGARLRRIDRENAGMADRQVRELDVKDVVELQVGREALGAGDPLPPADTGDALAEGSLCGGQLDPPAAAARTASTIRS